MVRGLRKQAAKIRTTLAEFSYFTILLVSAAAAIGEETLFRVFLQNWIGSFTTPVIAVVISSLAFGLAQSNALSYFILTFVLGLVIGQPI